MYTVHNMQFSLQTKIYRLEYLNLCIKYSFKIIKYKILYRESSETVEACTGTVFIDWSFIIVLYTNAFTGTEYRPV